MRESIDSAKEELKRVDHLIFVSLKYTRTCDIFKSIIERMTNAIDFGFEALLKKLEKENRIFEIPEQPGKRAAAIKENFASDSKLYEIADFFLNLRQVNRAPFERAREFRRHVTMTVDLDGKKVEVTIDSVTEDYKKIKEYIEYIESLVKND